ncbi:Gfo/Idh/MocA family protein [Paenibacillus yanchengensis]|uniref:Gfo/Idh/MocA family protein n=1 Tax=Paenibacillus yanchengensis TaxID=2035833 RepID=A0ABW4YPV3_9BACL
MQKHFQVLLVGCGNMAHAWMDYIVTRRDVEVVGLVDIHLPAAEAFAMKKQLNVPLFTHINDALQQITANLVLDISIPSNHYEVAKLAMQRGCDVLAEKPMAESIEQCLELVEIAKQTGRTHAIMQNRRFDPKIRALRQMLDQHVIGQVGFVSAQFYLAPQFGGFREQMESPLLLDMAIHTFDQARLITGANPVSVYCHEFNPAGSWYAGNAMAICIFEMSDGSVFHYNGSWCAEGAPTSWEADWRVIGSKGTAIWDGHHEPYAEIVPLREQQEAAQQQRLMKEYLHVTAEMAEMTYTFHHGCLDHMFQALVNEEKPETDNSDNIYSMAMVLAALESARMKQKVEIASYLEQAARQK